MKTEIELLIAKQGAGTKLGMDEIHTLMTYALGLLKDFERLTMASIDRAHKVISEQYKKAA